MRVPATGLAIAALLSLGVFSPCATGADPSPLATVDISEQALTAESQAVVTEAYRYLHEHPELGKQEFLAAKYLRSALGRLPGLQLRTVPGLPTAVIGVLDTGTPGPTAAFRAEMDARKTEHNEPLDHDPRSTIDGMMHNCGHDAHAAMVLGLAHLVATEPTAFRGKFVFVFQPAEEVAGGADDVVNSGVLQQLGVSQIYAQHVVPELEVGWLSATPGSIFAGSSTISIAIEGKGGHGAEPFQTSDVPLATARIAVALSEWPARHLDIANRPVVLSFTRMISDSGASNVLPVVGSLSGTLRAFEDPIAPGPGGSLLERLQAHLTSLAAAYNVTATMTLKPGAPPTTLNDSLYSATLATFGSFWESKTHLDTRAQRFMTAEDFSYYTPAIPSMYWGLGIAKNGSGTNSVHSEQFTLHPKALERGLLALKLVAQHLPDELPARPDPH